MHEPDESETEFPPLPPPPPMTTEQRAQAEAAIQAALAREARLALVLGNEGDGLDPATIAACDCAVRIPMARGVDSLNVAAASAVAFWTLAALKPR